MNTSAATQSIQCGDDLGGGSAQFNALLGTVSGGGGGLSGGASARTDDQFTLQGAITGLAVTLRARLAIQGSAYSGSFGYGSVYGWLRHAGNEKSFSLIAHSGSSAGCDTAVVMTLPIFVATPFPLSYELSGSGGQYGSGSGTGTLTFLDLPQGTSIVSCRGYEQSTPVPTSTTTWARMKSHYR